MSEYDDANRAFIQAFLGRSVLTLDSAKPLIAAVSSIHEGREILPGDVDAKDLRSYVALANAKLSPLDLEIRSIFHQQTRERCYALVNTTSDPLTQLATTYSAEEISYVKRLLDGMFDGHNNRGKKEAMCLSGIEAVQLGKPDRRNAAQNGASQGPSQGLTLREAEAMLARLVDGGWLEKSQKGFYSLSPRALMELKGWLIDTYNEPEDEDEEDSSSDKIKFCHACKEIITVVSQAVNCHGAPLTLARVNVVLSGNALAAFTISVHNRSSGCIGLRPARSARLPGTENISLERRPSRLPTVIRKANDEALTSVDLQRQSSMPKMTMLTKGED